MSPGAGTGSDSIVRRLAREADAVAREHAREQAEVQRRQRISRMQELIAEFSGWLDLRGGRMLLADLGVEARLDPQRRLVLTRERHSMELRARDDLTIAIDGAVYYYPDRVCPVLDGRSYDEILSRIMRWARTSAMK